MKLRFASAIGLALLCAAGCGVGSEAPAEPPAEPETVAPVRGNPIVSLLESGDVVFGIFAGERTPESAAEMAKRDLVDFVFYSLESGPFDLPTMSAYQEALASPDAEGADRPHPIALRIPPIRDGRDNAAERTAAGLDAGVASIVFPHVESAEEARHAVASMRLRSSGGLRPEPSAKAARVFGVSPDTYRERAGVWPLDPAGELVSMVLIEDRIGVERAVEIASVPGVSVVFPGPGDLRRAYEGDMEAVEAAIQTVLAACRETGVPCGITAGPEDIAARIGQGFRVFIVTSPDALAPGHAAAGR